MAALLQASRPYFRLQISRSSNIVHASVFEASSLPLNRVLQLVLTDLQCHVWRLRKSENSALDSLFVRDSKIAVELIVDLLQPDECTSYFCTA